MKQGVNGLSPFIGSKNYEQSRDFYIAMGWAVAFDTGDLAKLELQGHSFLLQNFYQAQWCENTMMYIAVNDARYWYERACEVIDTGDYGVAKVREPATQSSGELVTFVWDPVCVLWQFSQAQD